MENVTSEQLDIIIEALEQYQAQMELDDFDSFDEFDKRSQDISDIINLF